MQDEDMRLGRIAYEGYHAQTGGKSLISGADLPPWEELTDSLRIAWASAALNVLANINR